MSLSYNLRYPTSQKDTYTSGDNIDLVLSFPNQALVGNSVRVNGILNVYSAGTTLVDSTDAIFYDGMAGAHSFLDNISVSTKTNGVIETITQYPRYVKMKNSAMKTASQVSSDSKSLCQLLCHDSTLTNIVMSSPTSFSIDLDMCINNVAQNGLFGYSKTGDVTISFRLVQVADALYGEDVDGNVNYTISGLACEYVTVPEPKVLPPVQMIVVNPAKQTMNSANASINIKLPTSIITMFSSFISQSGESQLQQNNLELQKPDGIYKIYYMFNDSTNTFVSFPIETIEDMLEHYLSAFAPFNPSDKNDFTLKKINDDKAFGIGLFFESNVSMLNNSFGINILSTVDNYSAYSFCAFFCGIVSL